MVPGRPAFGLGSNSRRQGDQDGSRCVRFNLVLLKKDELSSYKWKPNPPQKNDDVLVRLMFFSNIPPKRHRHFNRGHVDNVLALLKLINCSINNARQSLLMRSPIWQEWSRVVVD